jgi:hypothetical protein
MGDATIDPRHRVWLYREPWRSAYLIALVGLFVWDIADLVRQVPDRYSHQHASGVLLTFGLLTLHLGAAYAPRRWQAWTSRFSLAFMVGLLLTELLP